MHVLKALDGSAVRHPAFVAGRSGVGEDQEIDNTLGLVTSLADSGHQLDDLGDVNS